MADKLAMAGELGRFVGFDSLSGGGMASSSAAADQSDGGSCDHLMYNSDAHFMTVLKQLGKRDTTTKLKVCIAYVFVCLCVCVCVCVCTRMCVCMRMCECVLVSYRSNIVHASTCMPCTLLQALAEFSSYCENQPVSELKCGLSIWPLMFNKLCTVSDDITLHHCYYSGH